MSTTAIRYPNLLCKFFPGRQKNILLALFFVCVAAILSAQPKIISFSPSSGSVGVNVIITGNNFSTTATNNIVFFGATRAIVTSSGLTQLTAVVPAGATYDYITVTVNKMTAYSNKPFAVSYTSCSNNSINPGLFSQKQDYATLLYANGVKLIDLDGDGKSEIAETNTFGSRLSIFKNNSLPGAISFDIRQDFDAGVDNLTGVCYGDIDGDGKPDIVTVGGNTMSVFRNSSINGTVAFDAPLNFFTGVAEETGSVFLSINDIDNDGKPDVAITNSVNNTISVFRNTSVNGTISFDNKIDIAVGGITPYSIFISDLDGDNKPDLCVTNVNSNKVAIYKNLSVAGTISFDSQIDITINGSPRGIVVGDLDGDDKGDLVVAIIGPDNGASPDSSVVAVFRNTSTNGLISFDAESDYSTGNLSNGICLHDIDGDGKTDIAEAGYGDFYSASVLRNTSTAGAISFAPKVKFVVGGAALNIAAGDLDGDDRPDMVVTNYFGGLDGSISVLRNQGNINLTINNPALLPVCSSATTDLTSATITQGSEPGLVFSYWIDARATIPLTTPEAASAGIYYIKATNENGCYDIKPVLIGEAVQSCNIESVPSNNIFTGGIPTHLYLGYGAQSTTLNVGNLPACNAPYNYLWSGGVLSNYTSGSTVFTPDAEGSYVLTVKITNRYGHTSYCSITICVTDIRVPGTSGNDKKVYLCHVSPGHPNNTLIISTNSVSHHLLKHPGDRLGSCDLVPCENLFSATRPAISSNNIDLPQEEMHSKEFQMVPLLNPAFDYFKVRINSTTNEPVFINVIDMYGHNVYKVSEVISDHKIIEFGRGLPGGVYFVYALQGNKNYFLKLVKTK